MPLSTYGLYFNFADYPWVSWADTHFDFFIVDTISAVIWRLNRTSVVNLELGRWALVFCGLLFFGFFGFTEESRKNYWAIFWIIAKRFDRLPPLPVEARIPMGRSLFALSSSINSMAFTASKRIMNFSVQNLIRHRAERVLFDALNCSELILLWIRCPFSPEYIPTTEADYEFATSS